MSENYVRNFFSMIKEINSAKIYLHADEQVYDKSTAVRNVNAIAYTNSVCVPFQAQNLKQRRSLFVLTEVGGFSKKSPSA